MVAEVPRNPGPVGRNSATCPLLYLHSSPRIVVSRDSKKIVEEYSTVKYGKEVLWRQFRQEDQAVLIQEAMEWKRAQGPVEVETKEKVVEQEEVAGYLKRGWSFVTKLDSGECVVRRRK